MRETKRNDDGATTVMVALLALVLFGTGALAIDIGQIFAKRAALQSNVDQAVLAAAAELDNPGSCNTEVVSTATAYLTKAANEVPDQSSLDLGGSPEDGDGFIRCDDWKVDLWAPASHVSYGMARAVTDTEGVDVPAHAAVQIKSPSTANGLPMYAVSGCDSGHQQISDPPPGHQDTAPATPPDSLVPSGNGDATFTITPAEVESGTTSTTMTVDRTQGTDLSDVTAVGFSTADGEHLTVEPTTTSKQQLTVPVPSVGVLDTDGIWWVRVLVAGEWSATENAQPFSVGELLFCDGAISGNFGTLKLARSDVNGQNNWLAMNIIKGAQPLLAEYDGPAIECDDASPWVTSEKAPPVDGTNCVGTDPGFPNSAATDGFITGAGGLPGRLDHDTTPGCDRNGGSDRTSSTPHGGPALNDDTLGCFVLDGYDVNDVIAGNEEAILSADILDSPRFFLLPVIPVQAEQGSSNFYPIVDFRPGFITEEGSGSVLSDWNGIGFHSHHVERVDVVLFDEAALPDTAPPVGGEVDYTGSGIKVPVLVE